MKLRLSNEPGQLAGKAGYATRRLRNHGQIKVQVAFRGQDSLHPEAGRDLLLRFIDMIDGTVFVESITSPHRNLIEMVLVLVD